MSKIAIVYWSGTGSTELMASLIAEGIKAAGLEATLITADNFSADMLDQYDKIAFGCPAMGAEQLEDSVFDPMFSSLESTLNEKNIALFGSYGWGGGVWMQEWQERCTAAGAKIFKGEGLICDGAPDSGQESEDFINFGKEFAKSE